jgi:hypothetical protein
MSTVRNTTSGGNPKFKGLTDDQVLLLLSAISSHAYTMFHLCAKEAELAGGAEIAHTFNGLSNHATLIGALADVATDGGIESLATWLTGPSFCKLGAQ